MWLCITSLSFTPNLVKQFYSYTETCQESSTLKPVKNSKVRHDLIICSPFKLYYWDCVIFLGFQLLKLGL
jgi:hypothetical protein